MDPQTATGAKEEKTPSSPLPTCPPPLLVRDRQQVSTVSKPESFIEFELRSVSPSLPLAKSPADSSTPDSSPETSLPATPRTPSELESSPCQDNTTESEAPTLWMPYMNRFRVVACCMMLLGNGLHDAAPGALLTYIQKHYDIGYGLVSIIFLGNAIGFISAALFTNWLASNFRYARAFMVAEGLKLAAYAILATTPPVGLVMFAFILCGLGMAIDVAVCQVFILTLASSTFVQGFYQSCYGVGATVGPLIATALVTSGIFWSRFYLLTLGVAAFNFIFAGWCFWRYKRDVPSQSLPRQERAGSVRTKTPWQTIKECLFNRVTLLGGFFIFAYQGAEVSISGWVISFLKENRDGDLSRIGYVTAGFWGGITVGRFALMNLAHRVGERNSVFALTALALVLQLIIWLLLSIPGNAVAVVLSGLALGPISPCSSYLLGELIPRPMHVLTFSFILSIGSSGGALAPFLTGLSAQQVGTFVLHPICIALFAVMVVCWFFLPKVGERAEQTE